jgi:hypothetical protein
LWRLPGASLAGRPLSARVFAFKGDWPEFAKIWNSDRNSQNFGFWPVLRTRNRVCKCHPIGSAEKSPSVFGFYYTIYYTIFPGSSGPLWKRSQGPLDQESSDGMGGGGSWSSCSAARTAAAAAPGHARLGLETAFREDARALRARLHPFGRSRLELGYRDTLDGESTRCR